MSAILWAAAAMLAVATALALWRMVTGPSHLDRVIAGDVIVAIMIATVGLLAVVFRDATGLPLILGLSLLGFTGATGVARLLSSATTVRRLFERRKAIREEDRHDD